MMYAWSIDARTPDEVARLVRALSKHRYVQEADLRLHWAVDAALADIPLFAKHAAAFEERRRREPGLDPASRDPSLWRPATLDELGVAFDALWSPTPEAEARHARLLAAIASAGLPPAAHEPFACPADDPPHPELVLLDWVLLPIDELDPDRHAGALAALEDSGEETTPGVGLHQEGPILAAPELTRGAHNGVLTGEWFVWSEAPYAYADYVLRGVAKAAKLPEPVGYADLDDDG